MMLFRKKEVYSACVLMILLAALGLLFTARYASFYEASWCLADVYMLLVTDWFQAFLILPVLFLILVRMINYEERTIVSLMRGSRRRMWIYRVAAMLRISLFCLGILYITVFLTGALLDLSFFDWELEKSLGFFMNSGHPVEHVSMWLTILVCFVFDYCNVCLWGGVFLLGQWMTRRLGLSWLLSFICEALILNSTLWSEMGAMKYTRWRNTGQIWIVVGAISASVGVLTATGILCSKRKDLLYAAHT